MTHSSDIVSSIEQLLADRGSLQLSTLTPEGYPDISYTPFIRQHDSLYIFISELAPHTRNLRLDQRCSVLIIEDEHQANNLFARRRLILKSRAAFLERSDAAWEETLQQFETQRGKTIALLKSLSDFHLVRLTILGGSYIQGFGQAFTFEQARFAEARQLEGS